MAVIMVTTLTTSVEVAVISNPKELGFQAVVPV